MKVPPRSAQFDDVYFSVHDGAEETKHVFFDGNNLPARWQGEERFTIAETGFGTGLNFLLTWRLFDKTAPEGAFLDFISIEKYPLSAQEIKDGLFPWANDVSPYLDKMLTQYPIRVPGFHRMVFDGRVALTLIFDDVNEALPEITADVDAWFLDGFTPSKNPDMWCQNVFNEMARLSHDGTTFSTFTAAGFVKRGLMAAGFDITKQKGFAQKRDMLTGVFKGEKKRKSQNTKPSVLIHGAGLAGCAAAYVLKQYGFKPVLYDPNGIAHGASGNDTGLINPRFTAFRDGVSDFYAAAFAQTVRVFSAMDDIDYKVCGSIHLVNDEDKRKRFTRTIENWNWHPDHMKYLSAQVASEVAGIAVEHDALYLQQSGQVNPAQLCRAYAAGVEMADVVEVDYDVHILAKGAGSVEDYALKDLPIHTVRGQITKIKATPETSHMSANICYGGYISAPRDGAHTVGSTFQKWLNDSDVSVQDDEDNVSKLKQHIKISPDLEIVGHRASLRTAARDRFPIIGAVDEGGKVLVSTAHGSHGIVSSLAGAHLLADIIRGGPCSLSKSTIGFLRPQRFQKTKISC